MSTLNLVKSQKTFGGMTNDFEHESSSTGTKNNVSIFLPTSCRRNKEGTGLVLALWSDTALKLYRKSWSTTGCC